MSQKAAQRGGSESLPIPASKPGGTAGADQVPLSRYADLVNWTNDWMRVNADHDAWEKWLELREFIVVKGTR